MAGEFRTVIIENVTPELDGGRYPVKREVGGELVVEADIFREGHDQIAARLLYRRYDERDWRARPMAYWDNDRWRGSFPLGENTRYVYTIEAAPDVVRSWAADLKKRVDAGQDVTSELLEGRRVVEEAAGRAAGPDRQRLRRAAEQLDPADCERAVAVALEPELADLAGRYDDPALRTCYDRELEVVVDRERAAYAAWYELFPRSQGTDPSRGATFREAEGRLPAIAAMGFDVVYMTPIHPIGRTNRKGPNNSLVAGPADPGSPYAIGGEAGGHTAVHPDLGTLADFEHFERRARELGMELAMDFAIQVSPDHPWVREHPEWFYHRADGTIKFAENPPKKYEDIYPLNFYGPHRQTLYEALREVLRFWIRHGVRIFRVDNPHTKPFDFWGWLIGSIQAEYPDVIFLSEAFTRPKVMKLLAKAGFTQSYTYFTWRNEKQEYAEYLTEITSPPVSDYLRGNLFVNTPDILPEILQAGGRAAFIMRLVLAATSSSVYGMYSGYELCENRAREPGSEYYADSEMYQYKVWDWDRAGNIVEIVTLINRIRRENPALQQYRNLRLFRSDNPRISCYGKQTPDRSNTIVVVVNMDPFTTHDGLVELPLAELGLDPDQPYEMCDLLSEARYTWRRASNYVRVDPAVMPAHIFRLRQRPQAERGFEYF